MNPAIHGTGRVLATFVLLLFSLLCASGVARAQSNPDRAALEALLFRDRWQIAGPSSNNWNGGSIPEETNLNDLHGVTADSDGRVSQILLNSNRLSGSIPTELGNLTGLEDLRLHNNKLSGTIPTELGQLSSLTSLSLGDNQLSGSIPTELGNLTDLQYPVPPQQIS